MGWRVGAESKKCRSAASSAPERIVVGRALKLTMTAEWFAAASPLVQASELGSPGLYTRTIGILPKAAVSAARSGMLRTDDPSSGAVPPFVAVSCAFGLLLRYASTTPIRATSPNTENQR